VNPSKILPELQWLWNNPQERDKRHAALREKHTVFLTDDAPSTFVWASKRIAAHLAGTGSVKILDIGGGDGQYLKYLLEQPNLVEFGIGLDRHNRRSPVTLQNFERKRWAFVQGDARCLPFRDNLFSAAMANRMLNQTGNIAQALSEANRVLEPGGKLFIVTTSNEKGSILRQIHEEAQAELGFPVRFYQPSTKPDQRLGVDNGREWLSPHFANIDLELYQRKIVHNRLETALEQYRTGLIFHKADAFEGKEINPDMWVRLYERVADKLGKVLAEQAKIELIDGAGMFTCRKE
jgi:SAM-dependent methyltransferase